MKKYINLIIVILLILSSCSDLESMNNEPLINQSVTFTISDSATLHIDEISLIEETTKIVQEELDYIDENQGCVHCPSSEVLSYHSFDYDFIKYVGEDEFWKWYDNAFEISEKINSPECRNSYVNIYNFIKDFNISRGEFEKLLANSNSYYYYDYNLDILYGGDEKVVDEYYRTEYDRILELRKSRNELSLKYTLCSYVEKNMGKEEYETWVINKEGYEEDILLLYQWSIPEIILEFDIPREYVEERVSYNPPHNPHYTYDLDKIYSIDKALSNTMERADRVDDYRAIDELIRIDDSK